MVWKRAQRVKMAPDIRIMECGRIRYHQQSSCLGASPWGQPRSQSRLVRKWSLKQTPGESIVCIRTCIQHFINQFVVLTKTEEDQLLSPILEEKTEVSKGPHQPKVHS